MARRRTGFVQRNYTRRGTIWGRSPAVTGFTALAAVASVLDSSAVSAVDGETVVRIRGWIGVRSDQQAVNEDYFGAVGALVASDQAVAVGVGSLPTPYTDMDSDLWMMHQYFGGSLVFASGVGITQNAMQVFHFDSKAMRKMEPGQTLVFVVENGSSTAGAAFILRYGVLFKTS